MARSAKEDTAFTRRICSTERHRTSISLGLHTRTAKALAREIATLNRLRLKRNSRPRGTSSPVREVDVRPHNGDEFDVVLTLSWPLVPPLKVTVNVAQQPEFPASPVLVFRWSLLGALGVIASRVIASLDRLPAGIRLDGDRLLVDIPVMAARGPAAALLPYVKTLQLHTIDDRTNRRWAGTADSGIGWESASSLGNSALS